MGKGNGKKGRREAKIAAKKANEAPKIPGAPRPVNPVKKARKLISREKKAHTNPPGPENFPIPMGRPKPFTKSPQHAKWPALFKKHLGVIEAHIRSLDRVMQSMKSQMGQMEEKERLEWELGERGNWRVICEMMDRAREVLASAREAAKGILPSRALRDKKGLGVAGTNFEPLGPKLAEKAAELGYTKRGKLGRDPDAVSTDNDEDTEMSDSSISSDEDDAVADGVDFVPLAIGKKLAQFPVAEDSGEAKDNETVANGVEPNPYFVIDTEPTPVVLNGNGDVKKSKKRVKEEHGEGKKSKKAKKEKTSILEPAASSATPELAKTEVDFTELEAQLQAEIKAGSKALAQEDEAAESTDEKKSRKKRRRSSDGAEGVVGKKAKKEKSMKAKGEETPADDAAEGAVEGEWLKESAKESKLERTSFGEDMSNEAEEKAKKEKKKKKRKADESADGADLEGGRKKKRKNEITPDSE